MMIRRVCFALENRQASRPFNLAHKLRRTENVLNGNEMRETEIKVVLSKEIQKQMATR